MKVVLVFSLFFSSLFSPLLSAESVDQHQGIGLRYSLTSESSLFLAQLLIDNVEKFSGNIFFRSETRIEQDAVLESSNCRFILWKNHQKEETSLQNRIECELEFSNYKKANLSLDLTNVAVGSLIKFDKHFPSLELTGEMIEVIAHLLEEASYTEEQVQQFLGANNERIYILGDLEQNYRPAFICRISDESIKCSLEFAELKYQREKVDLGENANLLIEAICLGAASQISGECPKTLIDVHQAECYLDTIWVPYGYWGAIDDQAKINCRYLSGQQAQDLSFTIGSVVVNPWGNRFTDPSVTIRGPGLDLFYLALKKYAQLNKEQKLIDYSEGAPPWLAESLSVQRFNSVDNLLSSISCQNHELGWDSFKQFPLSKSRVATSVKSCSIHMFMSKVSN